MEIKNMIVPENNSSESILESFGGSGSQEYCQDFARRVNDLMIKTMDESDTERISLANLIRVCCEQLATNQAEAFFIVFIAGSLKNEMVRFARMAAAAEAIAPLKKTFEEAFEKFKAESGVTEEVQDNNVDLADNSDSPEGMH